MECCVHICKLLRIPIDRIGLMQKFNYPMLSTAYVHKLESVEYNFGGLTCFHKRQGNCIMNTSNSSNCMFYPVRNEARYHGSLSK